MKDLASLCADLLTPPCPQCQSRECGPFACRFSGVRHETYWFNLGAEQVKRDQEKPAWLRNVLTGGKDTPNGR